MNTGHLEKRCRKIQASLKSHHRLFQQIALSPQFNGLSTKQIRAQVFSGDINCKSSAAPECPNHFDHSGSPLLGSLSIVSDLPDRVTGLPTRNRVFTALMTAGCADLNRTAVEEELQALN